MSPNDTPCKIIIDSSQYVNIPAKHSFLKGVTPFSEFLKYKKERSTVFIPIPAHAPITAQQRHFQFKIFGTINRPLKSSRPVTSNYVPSPVLNTKNHQLTLC